MKYLKTSLEDWIEKLYKQIGIRRPEQLDMEIIAGKLNIRLFLSHFGSRAIDWPGKPEINIFCYQSSRSQWQDFGHELCHVLRDSGNQLNLPMDLIQWQEVKADNFARQFCVPTFMLKRLYLPRLRQHAVSVVAEAFCVTCEFADRRLLHFEKQIEGMLFHEALWTGKVAEPDNGFYF